MDRQHGSAQGSSSTTVTSGDVSMKHSGRSPSNSDPSRSPEAGPSRLRSSSTTEPVRPSSPETVFPARPSTPHLDLATYPTTSLLRMLAQLLQHIAESNDSLRMELDEMEEDTTDTSASQPDSDGRSSQHPHHPSPTTALFHSDPPISTPTPAFDDPLPLFTASKSSLGHSSSLLAFHARHVPSISIEAYLLRILKYCPTTNEVFLGLLVYFDRMSRLGTPAGVGGEAAGARRGVGRGFAIDSYNVHRLVIAGVTVASKFFSDVFYTNSRYAKVGGLPPHELNQLELQFLLLNDFRLVIPPEEMQRYGDRLLGYWEDQEEKRSVEAKQAELAEAVANQPADQMEVDNAVQGGEQTTDKSTQYTSSSTTAPTPNPTPPAATPAPPLVSHASASSTRSQTPPRGREREARPGSAVSFADAPRNHHSAHGGLRSWVAGTVGTVGTVGGEVLTGRVASPMRD